MGVAAVFLIVVVLMLAIGAAVGLFGVGGGLWARKTSPEADGVDGGGEGSRPAHHSVAEGSSTEFLSTPDRG